MRVKWTGEGGKCWGEIEDKIPPEFIKYIDDNAESIAQAIEFRAKATAMFIDKTGYLRSKIKARKSKFEGGGWIVGAWAPHAWLVEFGHRMVDWRTGRFLKVHGMDDETTPRPFLRRALQNTIAAARVKFGVK